MSGVAAASIIGGNPANGRRPADFYPTPHECTDALIDAEIDHLPQTIWEPACGAGAISKRLSNRGYHVQSSDLNNHGFGAWGVDFLDAEERLADAIVTNPPFSLAEAFIYKADTLGVQYMALVLKAHFWHAKRRTALFAQWQPARFYAMNWRPQFGAGSSPTMDFIWCVWDRRTPGPTTYSILEKRT